MLGGIYGVDNYTRSNCVCHATTVPCSSCTNYPMSNVVLNPNNLLNYPENTILYGFSHAYFHHQEENNQEASHDEQMAIHEINSWLESDPADINDGNLNLTSYGSGYGNQYRGQFIQTQTQGFQASLLPMVAGVHVPEATNIGTIDLPQEWPLINQCSFSPFYPGNLRTEAVRDYSSSTSIPSQQLISSNDLQRPSRFPPMSRQDRIQRYLEKKKARKYEKKKVNSRRKAYAKTRPRIRGRFAASTSKTEAQ